MGSNHFRVEQAVAAVAVSADGSLVAVGGGQDRQGGVSLWDVKAKKQLHAWPTPVVSLALSADGKMLAAVQTYSSLGAIKYRVLLWHVAIGKPVHTFDVKTEGALAVGFMAPDAKLVYAAARDKTVELKEVETEEGIGTPLVHSGMVRLVSFASDGRTLVTGSDYHTFHLWDVADSKELKRFRPDQEIVSSESAVVCSNDRSRLAVCSYPGRLRFYQLPSGKLERELDETDVTALAFANDGETCVAGSKHFYFRLWNARSGRETHPLFGHPGTMGAVAISPDGKLVATAAYDRSVQIWEAATGKQRHRFPINAWAHSLVFTPDSQGVVFAGRQGLAASLTRVHDGKELRTFPGSENQHLHLLANSADGKQLLGYARGNNTLYVWDYTTAKLEAKIGEDAALRLWTLKIGGNPNLPFWARHSQAPLDLSPDGRIGAVIETGDSRERLPSAIGLRDLATGTPLRGLDPAAAASGASDSRVVRFSPDGRTLVCINLPVSIDETRDRASIHIYETATGRLRRSFRGHASGTLDVDFSANGQFMVTAGHQEPALVWDLHAPTKPLTKPTPERLSFLWDRLAHADAREMPEVLSEWSAGGDASVDFLRRRLEPAAPVPDPPRIAAWIADLDSDTFLVRQNAIAELTRLAENAEPMLRKSLDKPSSLEARRRIEALLADLQAKLKMPAPARLRYIRALEVLERIGSTKAQQVVAALAKGPADVWLTQDAQATSSRMARRHRP
jgi:WD40 repeat protein